jgi:hypothetical protein
MTCGTLIQGNTSKKAAPDQERLVRSTVTRSATIACVTTFTTFAFQVTFTGTCFAITILTIAISVPAVGCGVRSTLTVSCFHFLIVLVN